MEFWIKSVLKILTKYFELSIFLVYSSFKFWCFNPFSRQIFFPSSNIYYWALFIVRISGICFRIRQSQIDVSRLLSIKRSRTNARGRTLLRIRQEKQQCEHERLHNSIQDRGINKVCISSYILIFFVCMCIRFISSWISGLYNWRRWNSEGCICKFFDNLNETTKLVEFMIVLYCK
jgi:hypothetical protein